LRIFCNYINFFTHKSSFCGNLFIKKLSRAVRRIPPQKSFFGESLALAVLKLPRYGKK